MTTNYQLSRGRGKRDKQNSNFPSGGMGHAIATKLGTLIEEARTVFQLQNCFRIQVVAASGRSIAMK